MWHVYKGNDFVNHDSCDICKTELFILCVLYSVKNDKTQKLNQYNTLSLPVFSTIFTIDSHMSSSAKSCYGLYFTGSNKYTLSILTSSLCMLSHFRINHAITRLVYIYDHVDDAVNDTSESPGIFILTDIYTFTYSPAQTHSKWAIDISVL